MSTAGEKAETMDSANTPFPTTVLRRKRKRPLTNERKVYPTREKGTTALGFIFNNEGIMVALDHPSLSSRAYPNNFKVLHSHLVVAFSGGTKDSCKILLEDLPNMCLELEYKKKKVSAAEASKWLADSLSRKPDSDWDKSLGVLIAGWDKELGPVLYKVNGKGTLLKQPPDQPWVGTGSGSGARSIFLDSPIHSMSKAEATELAKDALCLGAYFAPERSRRFSVFHIGRAGFSVEVDGDDVVEWQKRHFNKTGDVWEDLGRINKDREQSRRMVIRECGKSSL
ncbi:OLC1v1011968C1 [Oldenlandia corymbosa var. corymbosa]|uniref:OLC1v1011968C1 n=1 Tax=Oldenlandia corymbosa var. corymbosa TaxID=529605 RepID=A0AAV1DUV0_OLDCO|nr:OLC1v1011968C1 [Oldenlandia corymbosa var. corymbosa]